MKLLSHTTIILLFVFFAVPAHAQSTVNVLLQEWKMIVDHPTIKAGQVTFKVQNRGRETHEIVILQTDTKYDALPLVARGGINEAAAGQVIDEIEDIPNGMQRTLTTFLKPGKYVLLCNMVEQEDNEAEQHYVMGMRTPFLVVD